MSEAEFELEEPTQPVRALLWLQETPRRRLAVLLTILAVGVVPATLHRLGMAPEGTWELGVLGAAFIGLIWTVVSTESVLAVFLHGLVAAWVAFVAAVVGAEAAMRTGQPVEVALAGPGGQAVLGIVEVGFFMATAHGFALAAIGLSRLVERVSAFLSGPSPEERVLGEQWDPLDDE